MSGRPILVTGAGGKTGRAVTAALAARGEEARAFVRAPEHGRRVRRAGAGEVVIGDLRDREAVGRAVAGTRAVYHICPNMSPDEIEFGRGVIAACVRAGVERLVYHSVLHPQIEAMPHHWAKLRVEEALLESGLAGTILQPAAYLQNLLAGWRSIVEDGVYRVPYGAGTRIAMVDLEDVAEAAARVLTEDGHQHATYELAGGEAPTQDEVAAALGAALGRPVALEVTPPGVWRRQALASGLEEGTAEMLLAMFRHYDRFGLRGNPRVLTDLLGRPPTGLAAFLARVGRSA